MRGSGLTENVGAMETSLYEDVSKDNFEVFFCYFNISEIRMSHTIDVLI